MTSYFFTSVFDFPNSPSFKNIYLLLLHATQFYACEYKSEVNNKRTKNFQKQNIYHRLNFCISLTYTMKKLQ